jgi:hypothetical protein
VTRSYVNPRVAEELKEEIKQALGTVEPRELPGPAVGPSDETQQLIEQLERDLQAPVDKRSR